MHIKGDKKSKTLFNSACRLLGLFNLTKINGKF